MKQRYKKDAMKQRHQKNIQEAKELEIKERADKSLDKKYKGKVFPEKTAKSN